MRIILKTIYKSRIIFNLLFLFILISCSKDEPIASFSYDKTDLIAPATVLFSNNSKNAESFIWNFGDGSVSTENKPMHTFAKGGLYTITLTAIGVGGSDIELKTITIIESPPTAVFTMNRNSAPAPAVIIFKNQSINASSYKWDFGDGGVSTAENPEHEYKLSGTYTVSLTAINSGGSSTVSKIVTVIVTSISGTWTGSFTLLGALHPFSISFELSNNNITGHFKFDDNTGYSLIDSIISKDMKITIYWTIPNYSFTFSGSFNEGRNKVCGSLNINYFTTACCLNKTATKSDNNLNVTVKNP